MIERQMNAINVHELKPPWRPQVWIDLPGLDSLGFSGLNKAAIGWILQMSWPALDISHIPKPLWWIEPCALCVRLICQCASIFWHRHGNHTLLRWKMVTIRSYAGRWQPYALTLEMVIRFGINEFSKPCVYSESSGNNLAATVSRVQLYDIGHSRLESDRLWRLLISAVNIIILFVSRA